jgi:biuret amidohydrolase
MGRFALLVVDPLKRFTEEEAPFFVVSAAQEIDRINDLAGAARDGGHPVVWTTRLVREQTGFGARTEAAYGNALGSFMGRWAELDDRLDIRPDDIILTKPRHSAFFATDLDLTLRRLKVTDVIIAGFTTNVCCLATAFDAVARDYKVVFARDALASRATDHAGRHYTEAEVNEMTFVVAEYAAGEITTTAELLPRLSEAAGGGSAH